MSKRGSRCKKGKLETVCGRQFKLGGFPVEYLLGGVRGRSPLGGLRGRSPLGGLRGRSPLLRLRIREAVTVCLSFNLYKPHN